MAIKFRKRTRLALGLFPDRRYRAATLDCPQ